MDAAEGRIDIEIQHTVPGIGISFRHRATHIGTGIGMEDIKASSHVQNTREQAGNLWPIKEIGHHHAGTLAQFFAE